MELWLVRHGLTQWNLEQRLLGWTDLPLCEDGRAQARRLQPRLATGTFDSVWTSDLARARETAALAYGPARADVRLRELDFGRFEGLTFAELDAPAREALLRFDGFAAPEGESTHHLRARVLSLVQGLPAGRHLLFTHGGVVRLLLNELGDRRPIPPATVVGLDWTRRGLLFVDCFESPPSRNEG